MSLRAAVWLLVPEEDIVLDVKLLEFLFLI